MENLIGLFVFLNERLNFVITILFISIVSILYYIPNFNLATAIFETNVSKRYTQKLAMAMDATEIDGFANIIVNFLADSGDFIQ